MTNKNDITPLYTCIHGSHLYGTVTENSDTDYKSIHIPSLHNTIFGKVKDSLNIGDNNGNTKMSAGCIDHTSFTLAQFVNLCYNKGDGGAIEMLSTVDCDSGWYKDIPEIDILISLLKEMKYNFTPYPKGMIGYVKRKMYDLENEINARGIPGSPKLWFISNKDIYHLARISQELDEYFSNGSICFPLADTDYLIKIKQSKMNLLSELREDVNRVLDKVSECEQDHYFHKEIPQKVIKCVEDIYRTYWRGKD